MHTIERQHVSLVSRTEIMVPRDPVADAWYAANCPEDFMPRRHVKRSEWLQWRVERAIPSPIQEPWKRLGCTHRWVPDSADPEVAWCFHCQKTARILG